MPRRAIVVGGGVGGLAAAVQLRAGGWDAEVHERAPALPRAGTSLGLRPGALRALDGLGLIGNVDMAALRRRTGDPVHVTARIALLETLAGRFVVIAADGLRSRARTVLFGDAHRPRRSGVTAWHGTADLDTDGMTETWGRRARFGVLPRAGGRTHWFACAPAARCSRGESP
ncbi:hypothetical protein ACFYO0_44870 [Streptomyces sp. NPDC006365]|uniref:hypothetical protein n=1 Tax=Streptomyces sp. NPDC006365 TaxID=3364744 RepID=UPI0036C0C2DC